MIKSLLFTYQDTCGVSCQEITMHVAALEPEIQRLAVAWNGSYDSQYAPLSLPADREMHARVADCVREKKGLAPSLMIVIGIGGSNLGAMAIWQALEGFFYNHSAPAMRVHFADSVDSSFTQGLYDQAAQLLAKGEQVLVVVISKSGSTTETVANAQLFTQLLKSHRDNYQDYLVVITDEGSPLWAVAQEHALAALAVPKNVGGRYSVLSPVALFPLGMLGIDTEQLCMGALSARDLTATAADNAPATAASIIYAHYLKGIHIHDWFLFVPRLEALGLWMRQLIGESLGKKDDRDGTQVNVGITPTVSIGSADLHSVAQLYLAGPNNRLTVFVTAREQQQLNVPADTIFSDLLPMVNGKDYAEIMAAMVGGVKAAYKKEQRSFVSLELEAITPYSIGQFMQLAMIEIIYLGFLFHINPFDQPQVELYKNETRKILSNE